MAGEYAGSHGVVIVDTAGTALSNAGGGFGSRVELLASGTDITTGTAYLQLATIAVPAWAHSLVFHATIESVTVGAMTALQMVASNRSLAGTAMGSLGYVKTSTTTAAAGSTHFLFMGNIVTSATMTAATGTTVNGVALAWSFPMSRNVNFGRELTGIPTAISLAWACYGHGG
jgi:hypothetical protein